MEIIWIHYYRKNIFIKINKLSTMDNAFNGKPCDVLYTGYLNKDISFGDIIYFEPKNIQYNKLGNGVTDQLKVSLIDGDGNEILSNFKISVVLHIIKFFLRYIYIYISVTTFFTSIRGRAYQIWELNFTLCTSWPSVACRKTEFLL